MSKPMDTVLRAAILWAACVSFAGAQGQAETLGRDSDDVVLPDLARETEMSAYLEYAALNSAGLRAAFERWKASLELMAQAATLPDPRLSYTHYVQEVETRVGPQRQRLGVAQVFPWFGKLHLRESAVGEQAAAARQAYEHTRLALFHSVKSTYHEYWYLGQTIAVTREHIKLVANMEAVARARFKASAAPHSALVQAQVELGKLDDRLRSLEALREPLVARLNALLNRPTHLPLALPSTVPDPSARFTDEEARQWLAEGNRELRRLEHLRNREEAGVRIAGRDFYPDITLGVDYIDTDDALDPATPDSGKDAVMATVSINLPLWQGSYRSAEREARHRLAAAESDRDDARKRLEAELDLALYRLRDAERKIDLYRDALVPKAVQSLKVAQQGFETGTTTFISLIDAERLLIEFKLAHLRARADKGLWLAQVEMLTGRELPLESGAEE
jgi:outer membrane protein TolC